MFQRNENGFGVVASTAVLSLSDAVPDADEALGIMARARKTYGQSKHLDWVPDLGTDIGSARWFRGLATCALLCGTAVYAAPGIAPLQGSVPHVRDARAEDEVRALTVQPLAWGGDVGRRVAPTLAAKPITDAPERPTLSFTAMLGQGDGFARVLERAGVGATEASRVTSMLTDIVNPATIPAGTSLDIVLGARSGASDARPLQSLALRARFDLRVEFARVGGDLFVKQLPIAVDRAPLRIQGLVGSSLYQSARAAGVPAKAIEAYLRALADKIDFDRDLAPNARFDIIVENERTPTGEARAGQLLFAGLNTPTKSYQFLQWTVDGRTDWYEATSVGQRRAGFVAPVTNARMSSGFGMRIHPILGYSRFHRGVDYAAVQGTPIYAVSDGLVAFAGRNAGFGNHIRISHSSTLGTSYSHLSRIAVGPGSRVAQGQLIGYVGSTGMSTGPHLHFEVYQNGMAVNPRNVSFASSSLLNGAVLEKFHARRRSLLAIPVSGRTRS